MDVSKAGSIAIGIVVMIVVLRVTVWPELRGMLALRGGRDATAVVKEIRQTASRDNTHRPIYRLTLEVHRRGVSPYLVTITQTLPWMIGPGLPGSAVEVRVHPWVKSWVVVKEPTRHAPSAPGCASSTS